MIKENLLPFNQDRLLKIHTGRVLSALACAQPSIVARRSIAPEHRNRTSQIDRSLQQARERGLPCQVIVAEAIGRVFDMLNPSYVNLPATLVKIPEQLTPWVDELDDLTLSLLENFPLRSRGL